jgi:hypothetical protein
MLEGLLACADSRRQECVQSETAPAGNGPLNIGPPWPGTESQRAVWAPAPNDGKMEGNLRDRKSISHR